MTDLLTPEEVREIQKRAEGTAQYFDVKVEDMEAHFPTVAEKGRLCRNYLTLWDRNKELEKERDQWKANHDCQVEMKHRLHERYDTLMKHFNGEVVL